MSVDKFAVIKKEVVENVWSNTEFICGTQNSFRKYHPSITNSRQDFEICGSFTIKSGFNENPHSSHEREVGIFNWTKEASDFYKTVLEINNLPHSTELDVIRTHNGNSVNLYGLCGNSVSALDNHNDNLASFSDASLPKTRKEHPQNLQYKACPKSFESITQKTNHSRAHITDRPFRCEICHRPFKFKNDVKRHVSAVHEHHRPFHCQFCDKCFATRRNCTRHEMSHTGEKPFACSECGRNFRLKRHLQRHVMVHMGHRPYKCTVCDKSFIELSQLKNHLKRHENETPRHLCKNCGACFSAQQKYEEHVERNCQS